MALNIIGIEPAADIRIPPGVAERGTYEDWRAAIDTAINVEDCPHWTLGCGSRVCSPGAREMRLRNLRRQLLRHDLARQDHRRGTRSFTVVEPRTDLGRPAAVNACHRKFARV